MSAAEARLAALEARMAAVEARLAGGAPAPSGDGGKPIASDEDLDSEWGDEVVKKDPKKWVEAGGESYAGCKMSECPPKYLLAVASLNDWMAEQDEAKGKTYLNKRSGKQEPTAPFARKRAARARGWAKRNAHLAKTSAPEPSSGQYEATGTTDEIPF